MLVPAALGFAIALVVLLILLSPPVRGLALDRPNERSLHATPVPRTGGLAIMAGVAGSLGFISGNAQALLLVALALAAVSFGDDLFSLPPLLRLAAHLAAATTALLVISPGPGPAMFVLLLLGIGWFSNLYNFMDGSDGLAGGMTVIGFGVHAYAAACGNAPALAIAYATVAAAALAFLLFNFHPAKVFMGDAGSVPLGFLAGALGVAGLQEGLWPVWFPVLVFSPFVADATFTLGKRLFRREKVWQAHRDHYYQRLARMGFGHRGTALAEYALMLACAAAALAALGAPPPLQAGTLVAATMLYVGLALFIDARWATAISKGLR
jgi:UDP-N-acetylmuramyl pentapeptide phosphotransferase/UDP-N-acetylglucosamine-1-phosphate transferase